jgi:hypothetical protein
MKTTMEQIASRNNGQTFPHKKLFQKKYILNELKHSLCAKKIHKINIVVVQKSIGIKYKDENKIRPDFLILFVWISDQTALSGC